MGISVTLPDNLANGTTADAAQVMANFTAITDALSTGAAASGANNDITSLLAAVIPLTSLQTESAHGATITFHQAEDLVTLSGGTTDSTIKIPANSVLFAVGVYVQTLITATGSPTAWEAGTASTPNQFVTGMGLAQGSASAGIMGGTAFYSDTAVRFTPTGGSGPSFTGGKIRLVLTYMLFTPPTS